MRKSVWIILISLLGMALACGRSGQQNQNSASAVNSNAGPTAGNTANDTLITAQTKLALIADSRTSGFDVEVSSSGGGVTLTGKVDSETAKSAAAEVAGEVGGVRSVNNQLQVAADSRRQEVNASDEKINEAIEKLVESDVKLSEMSLFITANSGVVSLRGEVDSYDQLVYAAQTIKKAPGVKAVDTTGVKLKE
jgi:osmotically-inducible protein OsmY